MSCTCLEIQAADPRRHFQGCALRAPLPELEGRAALLAIAEQIVNLEIACAAALLDCCKLGEPASTELHDVHQKAGDAVWMARERLHVEALDHVKRERGLPTGTGASDVLPY